MLSNGRVSPEKLRYCFNPPPALASSVLTGLTLNSPKNPSQQIGLGGKRGAFHLFFFSLQPSLSHHLFCPSQVGCTHGALPCTCACTPGPCFSQSTAHGSSWLVCAARCASATWGDEVLPWCAICLAAAGRNGGCALAACRLLPGAPAEVMDGAGLAPTCQAANQGRGRWMCYLPPAQGQHPLREMEQMAASKNIFDCHCYICQALRVEVSGHPWKDILCKLGLDSKPTVASV